MGFFHIDIMSDGSCYEKCTHCKHGGREESATVTTPPAIIDAYQRIEEYLRNRNVPISVSVSNTSNTLTDISFVVAVDKVGLAFSSLSEMVENPEITTEQVVKLLGGNRLRKEVALHTKYNPVVDQDIETISFINLLKLQIMLSAEFPVADICVGVNSNVSGMVPTKVRGEFMINILHYIAVAEKLDESVFRQVNIESTSSHLVLQSEAHLQMGQKTISFGGRFINAEHSLEDIRREEERLREGENLYLAMFPWGIHVGHSTLNIHDGTLKFSYPEFLNLLTQADEGHAGLHTLCWEVIDTRRAKKLIPITAS